MTETEPQPTTPTPWHRGHRPTLGRCLAALLVVEGLLWTSERFCLVTWHKGYAVLATVAFVAAAIIGMILWFAVALAFRRRFQFSIRSLLVLVVVIAVPCSWLAVEIKKAERQRIVMKQFADLGSWRAWRGESSFLSGESMGYDWEYCAEGTRLTNPHPPAPQWLRRLLGEDFFSDVTLVVFHGWDVTDVGLENLGELTRLRRLDLSGTRVSDAGLEHVKDLGQLQELCLEQTGVTDVGLAKLRGLTNLHYLVLNDTPITDAGLEQCA